MLLKEDPVLSSVPVSYLTALWVDVLQDKMNGEAASI